MFFYSFPTLYNIVNCLLRRLAVSALCELRIILDKPQKICYSDYIRNIFGCFAFRKLEPSFFNESVPVSVIYDYMKLRYVGIIELYSELYRNITRFDSQ